MTLVDWFAAWRGTESKSRALLRLHVETGISPITLRRALAGRPVSPWTAERLARFAKGEIDRAALVFPPRRQVAQ